MTRMFVAVIPPEPITDDLDEFLSVRRSAAGPDEGWRWTLPDQWHLTLAFFESVPDRSYDELCERLHAAAEKHAPRESRIVGGGAFPDPDRARVVFAGLEDSFGELSRAARSAASVAGLAVDGQRFRPHLTLARLGRPTNVTRWIRVLDAYAGPSWTVTELALVESHLGVGPGRRPRYEVRETFPLG
ncbi:MAG: thpR [Nocardioides sp.]|jgi:2'-5' RNA ligase|uniref:RNA 2',3'-cyclic phosphodiesterase n=1 Tax=Nocardioides sp. TaxID=35761 RepID=UPI002609E2FE|nr:RNA 2',3'-cyclic phosphodiesterase [Nocardioides sp.]MCW2835713.1 thpR [Nocardioides sp.]